MPSEDVFVREAAISGSEDVVEGSGEVHPVVFFVAEKRLRLHVRIENIGLADAVPRPPVPLAGKLLSDMTSVPSSSLPRACASDGREGSRSASSAARAFALLNAPLSIFCECTMSSRLSHFVF